MPQDDWSNIIQPNASISLTSLKDVWHYRDLLWMFVKRDIVTNYKQTILGPLWFFIQPALTTAMFVFIQRAAKIQTDGVNPILYNLIGITAWSYFADCLTKTSTTFKDNAFIFGKVYFPRLILPLSIVVSNLIRFFIQLLLFIVTVFVLWSMSKPTLTIQPTIILFPFYIIMMAGLGLGTGLIVTSLTTKYRDLALLIQFGIQLLMYGTLMIPLAATSGVLRIILNYNPMLHIIDAIRSSLFGTPMPNLNSMIYSIAIMLILLLCGYYIFSKTEKTFTDTI